VRVGITWKVGRYRRRSRRRMGDNTVCKDNLFAWNQTCG
jgi:hypothetical protein